MRSNIIFISNEWKTPKRKDERLKTLTANLNADNNRIENLGNPISNTDAANLQTVLTEHAKCITTCENKITEVKTSITNLESRTASNIDEIKSLNSTIAHNKTLSDNQSSNMETQIARARTDVQSLSNTFTSLNNQFSNLENIVSSSKTELQALSNNVKSDKDLINSQIVSARTDLLNLSNTVTSLNNQLANNVTSSKTPFLFCYGNKSEKKFFAQVDTLIFSKFINTPDFMTYINDQDVFVVNTNSLVKIKFWFEVIENKSPTITLFFLKNDRYMLRRVYNYNISYDENCSEYCYLIGNFQKGDHFWVNINYKTENKLEFYLKISNVTSNE